MTKVEQIKLGLIKWAELHKTRLFSFCIKEDGNVEATFDEHELAFSQVFSQQELINR